MAMKFKPVEREKDLTWKEGAIICLRRPTMKERSAMIKEAREAGCNDDESLGTYVAERMIVNWKEIIVADPNNPEATIPLEFNDQNRAAIFEALMLEPEMRDAIIGFLSGGLGNLQNG